MLGTVYFFTFLCYNEHDHYDHYSEEDIDKVRKSDTVIVAPEELLTKLLRKGFRQNYIITIEPDEEDIVEGIKFETISREKSRCNRFYEVIASNYRRYNFNETIKWKRGIAMKF